MTALAQQQDTAGAAGTGSTPQPPYRPPAGGGPDRGSELRRRGRTTLSRQVVEKVAGQVVAEVASASGRSGGFLGIGTSADASARPKVTAHLYGEFADLELSMGIAYPGSLRQTSQRVRERVVATVEQLTGVQVHRVDIDVTFLDLGEHGEQRGSLR